MSAVTNLGGNFSSRYTDNVNRYANNISRVRSQPCPIDLSGNTSKLYPMAVYPSIQLLKRCPIIPAQLKVTVPSSVLTELSRVPTDPTDPTQRFNQYQRYQPPAPCPALPLTANMAGISKPSTRLCNLYTGV